MKRIRLLILLGMVAVALPLGLLQGIAKATGSTTASEIVINRNAQYDLQGGIIHVGLRVRCAPSPMPGEVLVDVTQDPPESPTPAHGIGTQAVVCDGQTHTVGVSVFVGPFDAGRALAKASFVTGGTDTDQKIISIIVMPG